MVRVSQGVDYWARKSALAVIVILAAATVVIAVRWHQREAFAGQRPSGIPEIGDGRLWESLGPPCTGQRHNSPAGMPQPVTASG